MSITDELRKWVGGSTLSSWTAEHLTAIADRIDAEHERAEQDLIDANNQMEQLCECSIELPVDADGVPIHIGDVMEWCDSGETLTVEGIGRDVLFYIDGENAEWTAARNKRHHHEPTVEDVLREMADEVWNRCCEGATASDSGIDELVAECAAKLRLAGENA